MAQHSKSSQGRLLVDVSRPHIIRRTPREPL